MKNLNCFLRKQVFICLLFLFSYSECFSENTFKIKESELNQILEETKNLTKIVNEQNNQLLQYQKLSVELRNEVENQKRKTQMYKNLAVAGCISTGALGGIIYFYNMK